VNAPDAEAWSPIHYCASLKQPSMEVLDILYCAGADVSLFSKTGNCTPLHCLARRKRGPDALRDQASNDALYRFVFHLVRNLRAPLQAQDHNNETCVHIAAEHGDSAEVLRAMLDSDSEHAVSEMRNSRGYVIRLFLDGMTETDFLDLDSRPWRSPSRNSVPCSVISPRNGVRRRPPLTLPFGPCIIPVQI
jgi:ankyrin repeat protein